MSEKIGDELEYYDECFGCCSKNCCFLKQVYEKQIELQSKIECIKKGCLPQDCTNTFQKNISGLIEEIGEVLSCDKRWKSIRNDKYEKEEKIKELADVFIYVLNLYIWSGATCIELCDSVNNKMAKNRKRLEDGK